MFLVQQRPDLERSAYDDLRSPFLHMSMKLPGPGSYAFCKAHVVSA